MGSETFARLTRKTYRKVNYCVDAYTKSIMSGIKERFHYYFSWEGFNVGVGFCKTTGLSGYKYMLSLDLTFFSCWVYFVKIKN